MTVIPVDFGTPMFDQILALRYGVLREPLGLQLQEKEISKEFKDIHFAMLNSEWRLIGTSSYRFIGADTWQMRQVCIDTAFRGKGLGSTMVTATEIDMLKRLKSEITIVLEARQSAVTFYQKLDYSVVGIEFEKIGITHCSMTKTLAPTKS